jgi:hypothetical protein
MTNDIKKLYSIYPRIYCSGAVYVNNVPVAEWFGNETTKGGFGGDIMINQSVLQSGKFKVVGKMFPRKGLKHLTEEETMSIEFFSADVNNWKASRMQFHPKIESPWDGLSENIKYPYFEVVTEIEVELPFVLDGWQKSIDLTKIDKKKLKIKVLEFYRNLHAVLQEHNASKFLDLSIEKMKLQEQAFYFDEARKKSFMEGAIKLFTENLQVKPLIDSELDMQIFGNGKLVRLIKRDGSQPLQFISPDKNKQSNIELEVKLHMRSLEKGLSII